jgi:hypothetical protein
LPYAQLTDAAPGELSGIIRAGQWHVILVKDPLVDSTDGRTLRRIGDDYEMIPVLISTIRSLDGDLETLLNHLWLPPAL